MPESLDQLIPKKRGRPFGSKNRKKGPAAAEAREVRYLNRVAASIAWLTVVDKKTLEEVGAEVGLTASQVREFTTRSYYKAHVRDLHMAIGTVREAALKRYTFEVENLVELAIERIRGILNDPEAKQDVVLKAAVAVLDRAGVSAARKVEGTIRFELPEASLQRIEEAVRELPLLEDDDGRWAYALEKPKIRVVDDEPLASEPKDELI